jgi:adenosylcobinamide-phosphate synthase
MSYQILAIITAYILDLVIGDPQWNWHPVRLIGRLIERLEKRLNVGNINKKFSGVMLIILVVGITIFCVWGILRLARLIHPLLYYVCFAILIYFCLSIKALAVEANKVYSALKKKNIQEARNNLSMIVGRDTDKLEEAEIIKATVETVAESTMDGIIAPLFYAFLGGPVLVWMYKAINTLDSMVGYKNKRFIEFGKPSARLDGLLNFIPAKITCFLISFSSCFYGKDWLSSARWGTKYFLKGQEDNSIATEAAMAGALKIQLGGINFYNSIPISRPLIGDNFQPVAIKHIRESIQIAYISSALFMVTGLFLLWA